MLRRCTQQFTQTTLRLYVRLYSSKPPKEPESVTGLPLSVPKSKRRLGALNAARDISPGTSILKGKDEDTSRTTRSRRNSKAKDDKKLKKTLPSFIPFSKFPQAPKELFDLSLDELYGRILLDSNKSNQDKEGSSTSGLPILPSEIKKTKNPDFYVDFEIPKQYMKSLIAEDITGRDKAVVEQLDDFALSSVDEEDPETQQDNATRALKFIKLYYDQDSNSFQPLPEHILKRSLSGMLNLNSGLDDIDDEYLWRLIPSEKSFGVPPFEKEIHGFKKWESEKVKESKEKANVAEINRKEFKEFQVELQKSNNSLFRKSAPEGASGGRKKLDRKLMKRYKKLKDEGKLEQKITIDDEDIDDIATKFK
ncbi:uncharacterized protein KQ657_001240 [Scheffersomyces spartinae]|uniref:Uncharacterized protein n=1 Tax=Scheffersomyces spartinae TaxID=45513 RepID=A0A9P8AI16_9ASCO|nr:uncharacterized protein KQ657_001240 [Scheffersomyces spartinae]KAG7193123.1 hypothetical protein KQ657_001240 [Scheffersomyces spartinae]